MLEHDGLRGRFACAAAGLEGLVFWRLFSVHHRPSIMRLRFIIGLTAAFALIVACARAQTGMGAGADAADAPARMAIVESATVGVEAVGSAAGPCAATVRSADSTPAAMINATDHPRAATTKPADPAAAQQQPPVRVGADGVMRWTATGAEVALFGVNYSTPFAFSYRAHKRLGVRHEDAIDADVAHMARLGFDAYRIHVWDREISDAEGNVLENEHLRLLDYLIARLEERGISILLTPIAWWGNGWPEPDQPTPGFSNHYSRAELSSDPDALRVQQNYIRQFLEHVNPYTGLAYMDDPAIIAFELFNEPRHPEPPEQTTRYINELIGAARSTGLAKPIFYNVSQNWSAEHAGAVAASNADGVSFQWYPTGLVRGRGIDGNALPHVDHYPIPAVASEAFALKARMVYEFDAADVMGSYIYPAMARSFREAGMQWATQFSYDPLAIAAYNTEYSTHFVNLVYAPAKAISLMIAAEAFRTLPRGRSYGNYPDNTTFGPARVSFREDLSELNAPSRFYHSGSTDTVPVQLDSLRHIAGVGTSPVVGYTGTGAYFMDRLGEGVWRLEVYPDVVPLRDPYGPTTNQRPVARLFHNPQELTVALPDLEEEYLFTALDEGNASSGRAGDGRIVIEPGVYLMHRVGVDIEGWSGDAPFKGGRLADFYVPQEGGAIPMPGGAALMHGNAVSTHRYAVSTTGSAVATAAAAASSSQNTAEAAADVVLSTPPSEAVAGGTLSLRATVAAADPPDSVYAYFRHASSDRFERSEMKPAGAYAFEADIRSRQIESGFLEYYVVLERDSTMRSYPGGAAGDPYDWDFAEGDGWMVPVVHATAPLVLFDARRDHARMYYPHQDHYVRYESDLVAGSEPHSLAVRASIESLEPAPHHFALQASTVDHVRTAGGRVTAFDALTARVRAVVASTRELTLALITSDGASWGAAVPISGEWQDVTVPLSEFMRIPRVLLPRPYPFFLPYWYDGPAEAPAALHADRIEAVEFSIDGRRAATTRDTAHGYEVERVMLVHQTP